MKSKKEHIATELRPLDDIVASLGEKKKRAATVMARIGSIVPLPDDARILDIGAASGGFVAACLELGYRCEGIEPWDAARLTAEELGRRLGLRIRLFPGSAEEIPFEAASFDVVHASEVMEHVADVEKAFAEAYRVLKPGGVFWFSSVSSICPRQTEIRGFPLFGWYPDPLKRRIMNWAKTKKPRLVGYTKTPAVNWFTPWQVRSLLERQGFKKIYDRWDLRQESEGGRAYRTALRAVRSSPITKLLADVVVQSCSYAAVK